MKRNKAEAVNVLKSYYRLKNKILLWQNKIDKMISMSGPSGIKSQALDKPRVSGTRERQDLNEWTDEVARLTKKINEAKMQMYEIENAIKLCEHKRKRVLTERYINGKSVEEIYQMLNISRNDYYYRHDNGVLDFWDYYNNY